MKIIVGLGNPGPEYQNTRHNIGFMALDFIFPNAKWKEEPRFEALVAEYPDGLLVKPLTYMNNSGRAVHKVLNYYGLIEKKLGIIEKKDSDLSEILTVIHDDIDLPFDSLKFSKDSSSGGHNGIKSIIRYLKTQKITRVRLGVKNELFRNPIPADKFVLGRFNTEEKNKLPDIFNNIKKDL